jgi:glycosyltransferase involved in cell wall biosynthesis
MKYAFDFTSAVKSEPTGIARYVVEILRAMLETMAPEDRIVLGYRLSRWHRREHAPRFADPRVTVRPLQSPFAFLTYGAPDVFHGLGVNIPRGLPPATKKFVTIHGFIGEDEVAPERREAYRDRLKKIQTMIARADLAFVVSHYEKVRTAELSGCPVGKLRPIYHGVDHTLYRPVGDPEQDRRVVEGRLGAAGARDRKPFFLCLGAVTARKNVPLLLEAFARSKARGAYRLVLAGQARSETPEILARIPALGLERDVVAIGHVSPAEVPSFLRTARALVHPSRYESFGLPLIEAMACGAPVLCSDTSAMPEITGGAARLFHPNGAENLSDAIDEAAARDDLCKELRTRGITRAAEFTWERAASETMGAYREVLGPPAAAVARS